MSNKIQVLTRVECANYRCNHPETMPADLKAYIGDGGRIEVDIEPVYPSSWFTVLEVVNFDGVWFDRGSVVCPSCADGVAQKIEERQKVDAAPAKKLPTKRSGKRTHR